MTIFDGVDFSGDLDQLVAEQLASGMHRGREDSAPCDWIERVWHALTPAEQSRLIAAVHQALTHPNPEVRSGALRLLDGNASWGDPQYLLDLIEQRWDLFEGLRGPLDPPDMDRGHTLVRVAAHLARGARGTQFRRAMALDPVYGINVLAALSGDEPVWAADHIHELAAPELDPTGARLRVLVFNLQRSPGRLRRAVVNLAARQPNLRARLAETIRAEVGSTMIQRRLLRLLGEST